MNVVTDVDEGNARRNTMTTPVTSENGTVENEETYKAIIKTWVQRAVAYCVFFIIAQISVLTPTPPILSLVPLLILDVKILVFKYLYERPARLIYFIFSKEVIHQIFSLAFKILLIIYCLSHAFSALYIPIPVLLAFLNQYFQKIEKTQECKYLSWLVITFSEFFFLISIFNLSLYEEKLVTWQPSGIIWPIYIGLCFCAVIVIGLVLFCLGTFLSWASEEIPLKELLSSFWLLLTVSGATFSIISLCLSVSNNPTYHIDKYYFIFPIIFLVAFIIFTKIYITQVCEWWKTFFITSLEEENQENTAPPTRLTFQSRFTSTMKKAPHVLMRISSSYFKPVETPKNGRSKRTTSLKENIDQTSVEHKRHFSIPMRVEIFSPTAKAAANKLCEMCCEKLCNAVIMECGHGAICYECCLEMWKTVGTCHMCRGPITQVLQIEKSKDSLVKVQSTTKAVYTEQIDEED